MPQNQPNPRLRGAFTAIVTPFTSDGSRIDYEALEQQILFQAAGGDGGGEGAGVTGIVIAGTTGESPTLSPAEHKQLIERAVEMAHRAGILAIAGTGSNSTAEAIDYQRHAAAAGADAGLSVNPYYNKPTQEGQYAHFMAVADAADLPVMLYNVPGRTGAGLTAETVQRLAAHPNVQAVKEASGNVSLASDIALHCPELDVLSGDDPLTLPIAAVGGVGVVSVTSNIVPARIAALCEACLSGRWSDALEIHRELSALHKALFAETNPIPVKTAMKMLGRDSGSLRLPMTPAGAATCEALRTVLTTHELL
jgi:4-hydroxy-tetrahydrodipicolinate synthase